MGASTATISPLGAGVCKSVTLMSETGLSFFDAGRVRPVAVPGPAHNGRRRHHDVPDQASDATWDAACVVLALFGAALAARLSPLEESAFFFSALGLSCVSFLVLACRLLLGSPRAGLVGWGFSACVGVAVLARLVVLTGPPLLSTDVYRYVLDGRAGLVGLDPYALAPDDPSLAALHDAETARINNAHVPTIYPPAAHLFFRAVAALGGGSTSIRAALLGVDLAIAGLLLVWLRRTGRPAQRVFLYLANPLVLLEGVGNGHIDLLGTLLLLTAVVLLNAARMASSAAFLALAIGVKFVPAVVFPVWLRRSPLAVLVAASATLLGLYLWIGSAAPSGSLFDYLRWWRFNAPLFGFLEAIGGPWFALGAALCLAGAVAVGSARWLADRNLDAAVVWPLVALLVAVPSAYAWYLLWITPFLCGRSTLPALVWTQTILLTYTAFPSSAAGGGFDVPSAALFFEFALPLSAAAWLARGHRRPQALV